MDFKKTKYEEQKKREVTIMDFEKTKYEEQKEEREIEVMINSHTFYSKPSSIETAGIVNYLENENVFDTKLRYLLTSGKTIRPGIIEDDVWKRQQVFCVDVDNQYKITSVDENLKKCKELFLTPLLIYKTFSGNYENQKHRLVFCLAEPIENINKRNEIQMALNEIFDGDKSTFQPKAIFFGGNMKYFFAPNTRLTYEKIIDSYNFFRKGYII